MAELFATPNCSGTAIPLNPGQSKADAVFHSVRFVGTGQASGDFIYTPRPARKTLQNPASETCIDITGKGCTRNGTNEDAFLYTRPNCKGTKSGSIPAGTHANETEFRSVEFVG